MHIAKILVDGSVLVKEIFQAVTKPMKTGTISRAETLKGVVRDGQGQQEYPSLTIVSGATVGVGRGSMPATHRRPRRQITKAIV